MKEDLKYQRLHDHIVTEQIQDVNLKQNPYQILPNEPVPPKWTKSYNQRSMDTKLRPYVDRDYD
eukprot:CAMPEP_0170551338 /NCGR_PEP_ID=MMETSP0211-20121228/9352_1 /TAXON_ID=311385 /ORGANISM="Pseudokeronopsis sp., Strain OXSARD2" /LENGTH=63 /DNA_ID=CAMNT_0010858441 /DNA_START=212 /DNA_END=403 /DNA_ORIENTATION=+